MEVSIISDHMSIACWIASAALETWGATVRAAPPVYSLCIQIGLNIAVSMFIVERWTFDVHRPLWPRALRKKQKGEKIERPREPARTNVVNLMEALRQSVKAAGGKQASATRAPSKKGKKRIEGQREMLLPIPGKKDKETAAKSTARSSGRHRKTGWEQGLHLGQCSLDREAARDYARHSQ
jgi:hypothetical protein